MDDNKLNGPIQDEEYLKERAEYSSLGYEMGDILSSFLATSDLQDLQRSLLMLTVRKQNQGILNHLVAMLIQLLASVQHNLKTRPDTSGKE